MKLSTSVFVTILSLASIATALPVKADIINPQSLLIAQKKITPVTRLTRKNSNQFFITIKEGEFNFKGTLRRTKGSTFIAEDRQVRVIYNRKTSRIVVINKKTGTEYYNYIFSTTSEGAL
ncbi:hypothetical protein NIES2101_36285 [Calothrix sp. HK-06]|nr:hypothetical protein NIES2101_36285 [Calothrix sp. HK-06]